MVGIPGARHLRQWWREVGPGFNKQILNPMMLRLAGRRFWYAARLEHVGRRSGKRYATPVVARQVQDGFAIPLPYGTDVDWLRNLEAAGAGELVASGRRYAVDTPRVTTFEAVAAEFEPAVRQSYRLMGVVGPWLRVAARPVGPTTSSRQSSGQSSGQSSETDSA